jgi:hypothetical protein
MEISGFAPPVTVTFGHVAWGLADQPALQLVRLGHRRRQADRLQAGATSAAAPDRAPAGAAFRRHQRMQLVEHDVAQVLEESFRIAAAISSASCSGVVSRMSGGDSFWRWRLAAGVSPVRCLDGDRQAHLRDRLASRLRSISTASAFSGEM